MRDDQLARLAVSGLSERAKTNVAAFTAEVMGTFTHAMLLRLANLTRDERAQAITMAVLFLHELTGEMLSRGGERVS